MEWLPWLIATGALLVAMRMAWKCGREEARVRILTLLLDEILSIEPSGDGAQAADGARDGSSGIREFEGTS